MEWVTMAIALGALFLQTIALIIGGMWALSRTVQGIGENIAAHKLQNEEKANIAVRQVGDTISALREYVRKIDTDIGKRITEIELYVRDNYIQKVSFGAVIKEIMDDMKGLSDRIEKQLLRMENKLDRVNGHRDHDSSSQ